MRRRADDSSVSGGTGLIDTPVSMNITSRTGLIDAGIFDCARVHIANRTRLIDAGVAMDVAGGTRLIDAGVTANSCRAAVSSGAGLIETGVAGRQRS